MKELLIKFEDFKREENITSNEAFKRIDEFAGYLDQETIQEVLNFISEYFFTEDLKFNK